MQGALDGLIGMLSGSLTRYRMRAKAILARQDLQQIVENPEPSVLALDIRFPKWILALYDVSVTCSLI
jgi:hypothetical protein